jgi:hypothetical protein
MNTMTKAKDSNSVLRVSDGSQPIKIALILFLILALLAFGAYFIWWSLKVATDIHTLLCVFKACLNYP